MAQIFIGNVALIKIKPIFLISDYTITTSRENLNIQTLNSQLRTRNPQHIKQNHEKTYRLHNPIPSHSIS